MKNLTGKKAHTYSVVARDPNTGQMGVAVQSHWFSVGSVVTWAEAGVGAVATQALVDPSYGPKGFDLMREGKSAAGALTTLLDADEGRAIRQVAMVDAGGGVASHTGDNCIPMAGHVSGEGFSVQANMMLSDDVWPAMAEAYRANMDLPLAERLVATLEGAESAGGDIRGKQSAAIVVVAAESTGKVWADRLIDLRVEDHPEPIKELKRVLGVHRAYEHMNRGDLALEEEDADRAFAEYSAASDMLPDNIEMVFWRAVAHANLGQVTESLSLFKRVFEFDRNWAELTRRLVKGGFMNASGETLDKILSQ